MPSDFRRAMEEVHPLKVPLVAEASVRLDGRRWEARSALALQLALAGRIGESLPHFEEAARRRPGDAELLYNWGTALAAASRYAEAAARFEETLRLDPSHARARHNLGAARLALLTSP